MVEYAAGENVVILAFLVHSQTSNPVDFYHSGTQKNCSVHELSQNYNGTKRKLVRQVIFLSKRLKFLLLRACTILFFMFSVTTNLGSSFGKMFKIVSDFIYIYKALYASIKRHTLVTNNQ